MAITTIAVAAARDKQARINLISPSPLLPALRVSVVLA
jgi:hypothetical protein